MTSSLPELRHARATAVLVTDEALTVDLVDGRTVSVPLAWYPRLAHATGPERDNWRLVGQGVGIHWPALEEDISIEGLLAGRSSGESQASLENGYEVVSKLANPLWKSIQQRTKGQAEASLLDEFERLP